MSKPATQVPIASPSSHGSSRRRAARRDPAADRRDGHRQPEERLRVVRDSAWPASTRTRSRARPATSSETDQPSCDAQTTNTTDGHDDEQPRLACGSSGRRGSSRIAVRGLRASKRASTSRLNPIAALRAATMQTHDPDRAGVHVEAHVARRQQRADQRKRQREHRVAEADERRVGAEAGQHAGRRRQVTRRDGSRRPARR